MKLFALLVLSAAYLSLLQSKEIKVKLKWLRWLNYGGFIPNLPKNVGDLSRTTLDELISGPLLKMKRRYHLGNSRLLDKKTISILEQPRCGNKDLDDERFRIRKKRYALLGLSKWQNFPLRIKFLNYWPSLGKKIQEEIFMGCAQKWAKVSGLSFALITEGKANIEVSFEALDGDPGPGGVVGIGLSPFPIGSSYLKLDSREDWKPHASSPGQGLSLEEAVCHEMGHNLGLGHSDDINAIMFANVGFRDADTQLSKDDIEGIQVLYGKPNGKDIVGIQLPVTPTFDVKPKLPNFAPKVVTKRPRSPRRKTRRKTRKHRSRRRKRKDRFN